MLATIALCNAPQGTEISGASSLGEVLFWGALRVFMTLVSWWPYLKVGFWASVVVAVGLGAGFIFKRRWAKRPELELRELPGAVEIRWRGPLGIRITADDAGLRIASPFRRTREIDADSIRELRVDVHRARHVLAVMTSSDRVTCGRPCRDRAALALSCAALGRVLRLAPSESFTAQPAMT